MQNLYLSAVIIQQLIYIDIISVDFHLWKRNTFTVFWKLQRKSCIICSSLFTSIGEKWEKSFFRIYKWSIYSIDELGKHFSVAIFAHAENNNLRDAAFLFFPFQYLDKEYLRIYNIEGNYFDAP